MRYGQGRVRGVATPDEFKLRHDGAYERVLGFGNHSAKGTLVLADLFTCSGDGGGTVTSFIGQSTVAGAIAHVAFGGLLVR